jgi:hypothetical protein
MRVASREYVNKKVDLQKLADSIEEFFANQGYETQSAKGPKGWIIQARKTGILRELLAAGRAFTITITGEPQNFKVSIGIGQWFQNIGVVVLESLALSPLVAFVEIPLSLWSFKTERRFWEFVEKEVELRV